MIIGRAEPALQAGLLDEGALRRSMRSSSRPRRARATLRLGASMSKRARLVVVSTVQAPHSPTSQPTPVPWPEMHAPVDSVVAARAPNRAACRSHRSIRTIGSDYRFAPAQAPSSSASLSCRRCSRRRETVGGRRASRRNAARTAAGGERCGRPLGEKRSCVHPPSAARRRR
jgi:hypothetical protein